MSELKEYYVLRPVKVDKMSEIKKGELFYTKGHENELSKASYNGEDCIPYSQSYILSMPVKIVRKHIRSTKEEAIITMLENLVFDASKPDFDQNAFINNKIVQEIRSQSKRH